MDLRESSAAEEKGIGEAFADAELALASSQPPKNMENGERISRCVILSR